jgi:hypothetical protein
MKFKILSALIAVFVITTTAYAGIEGGEKEIGGAFVVVKPKDGDATFMALGNLGYYLSANLKLGIVVQLNSDGDDTTGLVGGALDYLFNTGNEFIPYVGAGVFTMVGDDVDSDALIDVHAGLKQFIGEQSSINYELRYLAMTDEPSDGAILGIIGFSVYF